MKSTPESDRMSWTVTMFGWLSALAALGLLHEALLPLGIGYPVTGQHLDGHHAIEMCVAGFVDHTHPALAQLRFDSVAIERLTDHGKNRMSRSILGVVPVSRIVGERFDARAWISIRPANKSVRLLRIQLNHGLLERRSAETTGLRPFMHRVRTMDPDHRRSDP